MIMECRRYYRGHGEMDNIFVYHPSRDAEVEVKITDWDSNNSVDVQAKQWMEVKT